MTYTPAHPTGRLLLVGWDAADWKVARPLMDRGEMPNLSALTQGGVWGDITTLQPILSPMLWNSISTGMRADRHGVLGFTEVCPVTGNVRPVSGVSRKTMALWNMVNVCGGRSHVVNWFCSHPAEPINGLFVTDSCARDVPMKRKAERKALPDTFHIPADLLGKQDGLTLDGMAALRVLPEEVDPRIIKLFVPRAAEVDQKKDKHLATLARLLAESFTVHNYAVTAVVTGDWDLAAVYYPSPDHFSHAFMNFHNERLEWIPEEMFNLYSDVVNGAYRLHDLFLGRLLALAGDDTTVILTSDHGFHSDHLRPRHIPRTPTGPEIQHRELGMVAMRGPGIKTGERIYSASLLDIAPTALTVLGLPVGDDMPGRVIAEAFTAPPSITRIPTWEGVPGNDGRYVGPYVLPKEASDSLLEQFIGLGYIDPLDNDRTRAADVTRRESQWNLARTYLHAGRFDLAVPILRGLHEAAPERIDIGMSLAVGLWRAGLGDVAAELLQLIAASDAGQLPRLSYLLGVSALESGNAALAAQHLVTAQEAGTSGPMLSVRLGFAFLRLRRTTEAQTAFQRAVELDAHEPAAHLGLAGCALRAGRPEDAALHALRAIGIRRDLALAHMVLGRALVALGRGTEAIGALEEAVRLNPDAVRAHRLLHRLYALRDETVVAAVQHKLVAKRIVEARKTRRVDGRPSRDALREAVTANLDAQRAHIARLAEEAIPCNITIVSGLPRSGTSLMMQMLQAGGLPILADNDRPADEDNPEGYLEWQAVKKLGSHPELIREADGKVVKVISLLLHRLPPKHNYRVIFLDRAPAEVAASQEKMLRRRGTMPDLATPDGKNPLLNPVTLKRHRDRSLKLLSGRKNVTSLVVPYAELVSDPAKWIEQVVAFLGGESVVLYPERMVSAVRPDLYRNRAPSASVNAESAQEPADDIPDDADPEG